MFKRLEHFDMSKAALIIIDMQNDFLLEDAPIPCPGGLETVQHIEKLAQIFRLHNRPVIYTQESHRKEKVDFGLELMYEEPEHCLEESSGIDFISDLKPSSGDFIICKRRYSAFFATDLDLLLRGMGIDTLVLTGVATDVCVRATAQDAQQHSYNVIVPVECVAGTSEKAHQAALDNISYIFGITVPLAHLLSACEQGLEVKDKKRSLV